MSRPKVKAKTKPFTMKPVCPPGYRHRSFSDVIERMREYGICSDDTAKIMQERVDALTTEGEA